MAAVNMAGSGEASGENSLGKPLTSQVLLSSMVMMPAIDEDLP
jgi:hypothetical protein